MIDIVLTHPACDTAQAGTEVADVSADERQKRLVHDMLNQLHGVRGLFGILHAQHADRDRRLMEAANDALDQLTCLILSLPVCGPSGEMATRSDGSTRALARNLAAMFEPLAAARGIALSCAAHEDLHLSLHRLPAAHRILSNLMVNAIKHSRATRIALTLRAAASRSGDLAEFTITDDGQGLPHTVRDAMQDWSRARVERWPLPQVHSGLVICVSLGARFGVGLAVSTGQHRGTTWTVRVPAERSAAARLPPCCATGQPAACVAWRGDAARSGDAVHP